MSEKRTHVLKLPGYRDLWVGQLISQFGDVLHFMVFLWWAGEIAGPKGVAIVGTCSVSTYLLMILLAGTVADRIDRRLILLVSDVLCTIVVAGLVLSVILVPQLPLWALCVFAILLKASHVFQGPARVAAVARLVPQDRLLEANSLNATVQNAMPLAGNALGTVLLGIIFQVSASLAYIIAFSLNALTFLVSSIFMFFLPSLRPFRVEERRPLKDAIEGLKYIRSHRVIRIAAVIMFGFWLCASPFMQGYIQVAQTKFQSGVSFLGMTVQGPALLSLLETGFFLGFVIGSFLLHKFPVRRVGLTYCVAVAAGSIVIVPMGFLTSWVLFWILNFISGVLWPFALITLDTYIQSDTPDEFRGRVTATTSMIGALALPIGMFGAGFVIDALGAEGLFAIIGGGLVFIGLVGLLFKEFRDATMPAAVHFEKPAPDAASTTA